MQDRKLCYFLIKMDGWTDERKKSEDLLLSLSLFQVTKRKSSG
jgi:hypothetical protein